MSLDPSVLAERAARLDAAAASLKAHFIGIDEPIDEFIDAIRVWWILPETLSRPVIVNLWGMTGVGKTDLVRRLVKELGLQQRFAEVELSNDDDTRWLSSVEEVLHENGLEDTAPKVLLFDEIQRFRTVGPDGELVSKTQFTDVWELLSDGRLSRRTRNDLDDLFFRYSKRAKGEGRSEGERLGARDARQLRQILRLEEELDDIADMTDADLVERMAAVKRAQVYEPVDHSKALLILSGNLDEAYAMATDVAEADVDADIFRSFTEQVTLIDVKRALGRRFLPEQVARFGNVHIVYRGLRKVDYEALIRREVARVGAAFEQQTGIQVSIDPTLEGVIYANGVFPVQGVRPVFSSVGDILEANLARFVLHGLQIGAPRLTVSHAGEQLIATFPDGSVLARPFVGRVDRARRAHTPDELANVAVHEAGHALQYLLEFGRVPLQLVGTVADPDTAGFTFPHPLHLTSSSILAKVRVLLAGGLAEEQVFGPAHASAGRAHDREQASMLVCDWVRRFAFHPTFRANYNLEDAYALDPRPTDAEVEKTLATLEQATREVLAQHGPVLVALSRALVVRGRLDPTQIAAIARSHGLPASVEPEGEPIVAGYQQLLDGQ